MKNQIKVTSESAQASAEIRTEAAVRILPLVSSESNDGPSFKDGDGDGPDTDLERVEIDFATNGYVVTFYSDDGLIEKTIFDNFDEVLTAIRERH